MVTNINSANNPVFSKILGDKAQVQEKKVETPIAKEEKPIIKEDVVEIKKEKKEGFFRKAANFLANIQKGYIGIKEGLIGAGSTIVAGFATGAAALGLGWTFNRIIGKGAEGQSLITTPIKTAFNSLIGVAKKIASIPQKSIKQIITYPFWGFPKGVYNYIKNIQGVGKGGKIIAVGLGVAAAGITAIGTLIGINKQFADVDHGFKVGHNKAE